MKKFITAAMVITLTGASFAGCAAQATAPQTLQSPAAASQTTQDTGAASQTPAASQTAAASQTPAA